MKHLSSTQKAYLAGFLDGDGSIYVRIKPNATYRYGFQVAPYVVFFQSLKEKQKFQKACSIIGIGHMRIRSDGILEYIISREYEISQLLKLLKPFLILKKEQAELMIKILEKKAKVKNRSDFFALSKLIERFRKLNYSKKRKRYALTP
jgi:hypothetical protein